MFAKLALVIAISSCVILMPMSLQAQAGSAPQLVNIDVPGAIQTVPQTINDVGQIVGDYEDDSQVFHGFLLSAGVLTTIDFPGAIRTVVDGINDSGVMSGDYTDSNSNRHVFVLNNGVFTTVNDPAFAQTLGAGIDDLGNLSGWGIDAEGTVHGFTLRNGVFTTVDFPGANYTVILAQSFSGVNLGGVYETDYPEGPVQGFTYINGAFTAVNFPGSAFTSVNGINNTGQVAGEYALPDGNNQSYLLTGSVFSTIDVPGAVDTYLADINDLGQVIGQYLDSNNVLHGYLQTTGPFAYVANSANNTVSMIDVPTSLVVNTIPVGSGPWGVAISPDGSQVYVTNETGNDVSVINTASSTVVATVPVQSFPLGVAFTPDGTAAYVANEGSNSVSVINTASQTVTATVPVGTNPIGIAMALTSEGTFAYVTNSGSNNVSVIAVGEEPEVVQTIAVGSSPIWIAVSPNSRLAYVENGGSNNVSVISVASNTVTATIPVGTVPSGAAFSPDSSMAYVTNSASNTVSVIATASGSVVATVPGFNEPHKVALTTDGSAAYVTNLNGNNVSVITTATNTITATVAVGGFPIDVAIAAAPPTTLVITQPLSPTELNTFNFGTNHQGVQYPPDTSFSGINMTTAAVQLSQAAFQQRLVGTAFAGATCIIYAGSGGNCTDYQVTCSNTNGSPVSCPGEAQPTITVQTGFTTSQSIINPGYLTTPIGENEWQNIFTGFSDPTVRGKTKGFSEFVAVSLGATNAQGAATFTLLDPGVRTFTSGATMQVAFRLNSVVTKQRVTDATAGLAVTMIADANGNPTSVLVLSQNNAFIQTQPPGVYKYELCTKGYAAGKYSVTIFGNAFSSYQFQFEVTQ